MNPTLKMLLAAGALLSSLPVLAASDRAAVEARYRAERLACAEQKVPDSRQACLREAGAARAEALRGGLGTDVDEATRRENRILRCAVHDDRVARVACERMAQGEGQARGSVAEGGVLRELTVPADTPSTDTTKR